MSGNTDPIVNFDTTYDQLVNGSIPDEKKTRIGNELLEAFEKHGYVHMKNFGNYQDWLSDFMTCNEEFMALPLETKRKYPRDLKTFHGWGFHEDERPSECPKVHESFSIGIPEETPDEIPNFKESGKVGTTSLQNLIRFVFSALESALKFEPNYFIDRCSYNNHEKNVNVLRFIRYPPLNESDIGSRRFFSHKDFGALTILFLDGSGGLEVQTSSGEWIEVKSDIPQSALLMAGSMMNFVTDNRIKAVEHRVVAGKNVNKYRRTVVFFTIFDWDVLLKSPNEPVTDSTEICGDYLKRISENVYKSEKVEDHVKKLV